jgi:uncharacterized protein (TIGR03000 family)
MQPGMQPSAPVPGPATSPAAPPSPESSTGLGLPETETILSLNVPADATVLVNGKQTKSKGEKRTFVARKLIPGKVYTFEVKAIVNRDGEEVTRSEFISVTGGYRKALAFNFEAPQATVTTLAVKVPQDARVVLAGSPTNRKGENRIFSTTDLKSGQKWTGYKIVATIVRDGQEITVEKVIDVEAGKSHEIAFDFDNDTRIAAR